MSFQQTIEESLPIPLALLLSYPVAILSESISLSRSIFSNDPVLNYQSTKIVLSSYLDRLEKIAKDEPLISPGYAHDLHFSHFPTTMIMVGDVDPLLDDSCFLYKRLSECGAPVSLHIHRALPHGFLNLASDFPSVIKIIEAGAQFMLHEALSYRHESKESFNA